MLCLIVQSCSTLCDPCGLKLGSSVHGDSPGKNIGVGCIPSSRESFKLRDQTQLPKLQVPSEPPGKPVINYKGGESHSVVSDSL